MARYKMTVVFDVHDDEDRTGLSDLREQVLIEKIGKPFAARLLRPSENEKRLEAMEYDPLTHPGSFLRSVVDTLFEAGAFPYDNEQMPKYRTTCEIITCEKLKDE
jgi:hypothetical protein